MIENLAVPGSSTPHPDAADGTAFELTSVQRDMWFAQELHPRVAASVAHYLEIRGPVDYDLLQYCARTATIESGSLLTRFVASAATDGASLPLQVVDTEDIPDVVWVDVSGHADPAAAAREWMRAEYTRPVDLLAGPVSATAFITVGPDHLYWYARAHHTIIDGFGAAVAARRAGELYTALQRGESAPPARARHPREFLEADRRYRSSTRIDKDRAYWTDVARTLPDPVSLSGRTAAPSPQNHRTDRGLDTAEDRAVRDGAARAGTTVSGLVIAAFAAYLGRCTDRDDVVLSLPLAARVSAWMRTSAGMTANAVPLTASTRPRSTIADLVDTIGRRIASSLRHQLLPVSEIAGDHRTGAGSFGPTVNLMLFSTNIEFGDLTAHLELLTSGPTDDIAVTVYDAYGTTDSGAPHTGIRVDLEGNPELYSADRIAAHSARFVDFLVAFASADPSTRLADVPLLTPDDRLLLAAACDGGPGPEPLVLPDIFDRAVRVSAERPAVVDGDTVIDYRELDRRSNALGRYLIDLGVGPDTLVAMVLPRSHLSITAVWAVARAGGVYVPVDPRYPAARVEQIVADSGASLGITTADRVESLPDAVGWIVVDEPVDATGDEHWTAYPADSIDQIDRQADLLPGHLAYIVYTSGSTGTPKGVAVTHGGIAAITAAAVDFHDVGRSSRVMHFVSPSFDASVLEIILAFGAAGTLVVVPPDVVGGDELGNIIESQCIDSGFITPGALRTVPIHSGRSLSSIGVGGEAVPAALVRDWDHDRRVINVYGPTETTIAVTLEVLRADRPVTLGRPIPGVYTYVLDRSLSAVPPGCVGELYVGGPGLARGYLGDSVRTAERFVADPWGHARSDGARLYRTGDLVTAGLDGRLSYLGRRDTQVKIRGFRIELGEIEQALRSVPAVADAIATVHGDSDRRRLVAYVRPVPGGPEPDEWAIVEHVSRVLPQYMIPRTLMVLDSFPLTVNGKIDRGALPTPPADHGRGLGGCPTTDTEILVAEIMCDEVGVDSMGTGDDFFAVGGNSLSATRVARRASAATGRRIGVREVFTAPTVGGLAAVLDAAPSTDHRSWDDLIAAARPDVVPLSPAQRSMWLLARYEDSPAYHVPLVLRVSGELSLDAVGGALADIVRRHEALRTTFPAVEGVPRQLVTDAAAVPVLDRRIESDQVVSALVDFATPTFDLEAEIPLRAAVFTIGDSGRDHVLALVLHHICVDGSSLAPLARDLIESYRARVSGTAPTLPALPVQYADVTLWQDRSLGSASDPLSRLAALTRTWDGVLDGIPEALALPVDRPRPTTPSGRAGSVELLLPVPVRTALAAVAARHAATEFITVHTAVAIALARSGAGTDVVIGTAVAGRDDSRLDDVVGMFVNSVVLRTRLDPSGSLADALDAVRAADLDAFAHAAMPFDVLTEHRDPARVPGRHPLFQVMLSARSAASATVELPGATATAYGITLPVTKFDLEFTLDDARTDGLGITLTFDADLFDESTAHGLLDRVERVVHALVADETSTVRTLDLLDPRERRASVPFGGAPGPVGTGVDDDLARTARRVPHSLALTGDDRSLSYAEVDAAVTALAHRLRADGVGVESRVASFVPRSVDSILALLAVLRSGGACVPIDPMYPPERRRHMIEDAGARCGLVATALALEAPDSVDSWISVEDKAPVPHPDGDDGARGRVDASAAYVIYTSGTTGRPKGTVVTRAGLANAAARLRSAFEMESTATVLAFASPSFDASVLEIVLALDAGAAIAVAPADIHGGRELEEFIDRHGVTHAFLTPSVLASMEPERVPSLRTLGIGGENFGRDLLEAWGRSRRIVNVYGPTETTITSHLNVLSPTTGVSIDDPGPGVSAVILDAGLQPVSGGTIGELYLGGVQLARGYLDRPALTSGRFVASPFGEPGARLYRTGDLATWALPEGTGGPSNPRVRVVGRADSQVKIRGFRIELGEIDAAITDLGGIDLGLTLAVDGPGGELALVSYVHGPGADHTIADRLSATLPRYMIPAVVTVLDEVPLTPVGKIDRAALPAPVFARARRAEPATDTERVLVAIVDAVLDVHHTGADADFFDVGGTSLSATRYVARIEEALGSRLPVRAVFDHPVIADLAAHLDEKLSAPDALHRSAATVDRPEVLPLSASQFAMWFHSRIPGSAAALNIVGALTVSGPVCLDAVDAAVNDVVRRHESLRTVFPSTPTGPVPHIREADDAAVTVERIDLAEAALRTGGRDTVAATVRGEVARLAARPFDVTVDLPVRVAVLVLGPTEHVVVLVVHHIAADGFSMQPLTADLLSAYAFRSSGTDPRWAGPAFQYADHALALAASAPRAGDPAYEYWMDRLRDLPEEVTFPMDSPRPPSGTGHAGVEHAEVPVEDWTALRELASRTGSTPFMVVHAAVAALVGRRAGTSDVVLGTPLSGRGSSALDSMVGMAVTTAVLRTTVDETMLVTELLDRVRGDDLDALSHTAIPFETLVADLSPPRHPARHPLVQCMLAYEEEQPDGLELGEIVVRRMPVPITATAFDVTVTVRALPAGGAEVGLTYATDLYLPGTAARVAAEIARLLGRMSDRPDATVAELLDDVVRTSAAPLTLPALFARGGSIDPSAVAVRDGDRSLTYARLDHWSGILAACVRRGGAEPGDRVAVAMARSLESVVAFCAVARTGAAVVPLDPHYPADRLEYIVTDAAPAIGLTTTEFASHLPGAVPWIDVQSWAHRALASDSSDAPTAIDDTAIHPDAVAYVVYTSGTTGVPKAVEVTHRGLEYFAADQARRYRVGRDSVVLHGASPGFDAAVLELLLSLTTGALCVVAPSTVFGGAALAEFLDRERVTAAFVTPAALATVPHGELARLTTIGVGGEAPTAALVDAWAPGRRMINAYGPSESTVAATMGELRPGRGIDIGTPVLGTNVRILDASLRSVDTGVVGEMYTSGPATAQGYSRRPGLTAARFVADPHADTPGTRMYRTGDLARTARHADGDVLEMTGRVDRQVKIRGMRVEPEEVESILQQQNQIHTAVVLVEESVGEIRLVAYVTVADGCDDRGVADTVRQRLAATVPAHLVPSSIVVVDTMPTTTHGKIDRSQLVATATLQEDTMHPIPVDTHPPAPVGTPSTGTLTVVQSVFATVLGLDAVSADGDFFELGGTSLAVVRAIDLLTESLPGQPTLDIRWFFDSATPRSIAERLDANTSLAPGPSGPVRASSPLDVLLPLRSASSASSADVPPLFCIHPAVGLSWTYAGLLAHLDPAIAVYGIQARGIAGTAPVPHSVDEIARDYVNVIKELRPNGPYRLLGWSMGGLIAHAMAVELRTLGDEVSLFMMDAYPLADDRSERQLMSVADLVREFAGAELDSDDVDDDLTLEDAIEGLRALPAATRALLPITSLRDEELRRLYSRYQVFVDLGYEFRPRFYDGDMVFFSAATRYGENGRTPWNWRSFVGGAITDHSISCAHNQMTEPVPLAEIGRRLDGYLARHTVSVGRR